MKTVTLSKPVNIIGLGTLPKGLRLCVVRYNSRYIYAEYYGCTIKLTYGDTTVKEERRNV